MGKAAAVYHQVAKRGGGDPAKLPYGASLKRRIKGLAIYAEEAVSPKHALDRPISPSDFFRDEL